MLTLDILNRAWPKGDSKIPGLRAGIVASAPQIFASQNITKPLVIAHIMAQGSHECGAGTEVIENLNYQAAALLKQWPSHFTPQQALAMQHKPQAIANQAYNGRMGNRAGTNDGWTYRGRGFTQTTGRDGYLRLGQIVRLDLLNNPDLVLEPSHFLECGVVDFVLCGCVEFAEHDNLYMVTQKLNGGQIGASQRASWLILWKHLLGVT